MGPAAMAAERAAQREAIEQSRDYSPITEQGQHNEATRAENMRRWIERQLEIVQRVREKAERLLERVGFKLDRADRGDRREIERDKLDEFRERLRQGGQKLEQKPTRGREVEKPDPMAAFRERLAIAGNKVQQQEQKQREQEHHIKRQHDRGMER